MADVFHAGDQIADFPRPQPGAFLGSGADDAYFQQFVRSARGHHADFLARFQAAVHHADVGDHAAVGVVDGVENHRARGGVGTRNSRRTGLRNLRGRRRHQLTYAVQKLGDALPRLAGHAQHILRLAANNMGDFQGVFVRIGGGKVDFVQHRNDFQVVFHRQVQVRQGLSLDALRGVDKQNSALTRLKRAGNLIREIHVAGSINEVHDNLLPRMLPTARHPRQTNILRLNGNATLALNIHIVQILIAHITRLNNTSKLQNTIRKRGLTMINVGDDTEVTNPARVRESLLREILGHSC